MAEQSCRIMLWHQALASGNQNSGRRLAREGVTALGKLRKDFNAYWPTRNKGTTRKCAAFLDWRIKDFRNGKLHFLPEQARVW
jgi:hypothetical protein